ncbi:hypothetical protein CI610_01783 [invertebrate metagenome]|uniref:Uncharacterized protein n=1 Tax=invertebrate metagenome TaxID=1711999 RepID=A0A2H9T7R5_9ZZZZ
MNTQIQEAILKRFDKHRIIFWYDTNKELRQDFEALVLPDIEKVEIDNNELGLKYRVLRTEPEQKFLLYKEGPAPADLDNWLLDVQLSHGEFSTDQVSLWLSELELGLEFNELVQSHAVFFEAKSRLSSLKKLLGDRDNRNQIETKMMAVCSGAEPRLDAIMEALLQELSVEKDNKFKLLQRCHLDTVLWTRLKRNYGYESETSGIKDFTIELFKSCFAMTTGGDIRLSSEALVFLKRWKDSRRHEQSFESLSTSCAEILKIESLLDPMDFRDLMDLDYFRLIDLKVISSLVNGVTKRTITAGEVSGWVRQRKLGHWYEEFCHLYKAIDYASRFIGTLDNSNLSINTKTETLDDGVTRYSQSWYLLDQLYRKFIWHMRESGQPSLMNALTKQVENLYSNNYLLPVNNQWQALVDKTSHWKAATVLNQRNFFEKKVQPFLEKDKKVCVIISDALRYEISHELQSLIRQEDRFSAELTPALSVLPSYTQLGMAALLPHETLAIAEDNTGTALVNGLNSRGTASRNKILDTALSGKATAIQAKYLSQLGRDECRSLVRDNDVLYVYHNLIDKTGDERDSQERVFDAAETTLHELIRLVKKLTNANANNLLITADHGFIYQNKPLDNSDFSSCEPQGNEILYRDRRFILGKGLSPQAGLKHFLSTDLKLEGTLEIQIPNSINRLRLKGSGSQFVHGGAALQEVVVPILQINKKRKSDITAVGVEVLGGTSSMITSGQLAVRFYQTEAVTDKVQPRKLRAGLYSIRGELISDSHDLVFDMTSDHARERELQIQMVLSHEADKANNQEVILRLDEKLAGTSHYQEYLFVRYQLRRSFTSDFDF